MHIHKIFHIKTFKIAPTCFDLFRSSSGSNFKSFNVKKFYVCALVGVLIRRFYEMHGATMKIANFHLF